MYAFEQACRPVLFEADNDKYSYWGKGSSVLLANSKAFYWVTAKHVMDNLGGTAEALRIFPSDSSRISLPYDEKYTLKLEGSDDEDFKDLYILRIDLSDFDLFGDAPLTAQDIESGVFDPEKLRAGDDLFVIAYPSESRFVDYDGSKIAYTRKAIRGLFDGPSIGVHCFKIKIDTTVELGDYDGISGAPVFRFQERQVNGAARRFPMLVGLVLRGSGQSSSAHFVGAHVIVNAIRCAEAA